MEGGPAGSWRQDIMDAANGEAEEIHDPVRRIVVVVANRGDRLEKKLDRLTKALISAAISMGMLAASFVSNVIFGMF